MPGIINNRYYERMCATPPGTLLRNSIRVIIETKPIVVPHSGGKGIVMASQSRSTAEEEKSV